VTTLTLSKAEYHKANLEKEAARKKAYYEANTEKVLASHKAYRKANLEKVAAINKAYRKANPEKVVASHRAYRKANPQEGIVHTIAIKYKTSAAVIRDLVPQELMEAKILQLQLRRLIYGS